MFKRKKKNNHTDPKKKQKRTSDNEDRIPQPVELDLTSSEDEILNKVASKITALGMETPAIFLLEMSKPINYIGSQFLTFMNPMITSFLDIKSYDTFTELIADRNKLEELICRIEENAHARSKKKNE